MAFVRARRVTFLGCTPHEQQGMQVARYALWFDPPAGTKPIPRPAATASIIVGSDSPPAVEENQAIRDGLLVEIEYRCPVPVGAEVTLIDARGDEAWTAIDAARAAAAGVKQGENYGRFSDAAGAWPK